MEFWYGMNDEEKRNRLRERESGGREKERERERESGGRKGSKVIFMYICKKNYILNVKLSPESF